MANEKPDLLARPVRVAVKLADSEFDCIPNPLAHLLYQQTLLQTPKPKKWLIRVHPELVRVPVR